MNEKEKLQIMEDLVKFDTANDHESQVADYLENLFKKNGITTKRVTYAEGRDNLIAEIGAGDKILGYSAHEDVVSPGDPDNWTYGPFNPTEVDGKIIGRGATDTKGGLAGLAISMIELNQDPDFHGHIRLLASVGEEVGNLGAAQLADEGYADDLSALIVGEQSNSTTMEVSDKFMAAGLTLIPQPNPDKYNRHVIFSAHKGSLTYKIKSKGRSVHSSMPQFGVNAVENLFTYYAEQKKYFATLDKYDNDTLGKIVPVVTVVKGGDQPNTVPDSAEITVKIRTIPEYSNDDIQKDIQAIVDKLNAADEKMNLTLDVESSVVPVYTPVDSVFANLARTVYKETWGVDSLVVGATGGTDASMYVGANKDVAVLVIGPGNETAHQTNEYVLKDDYLNYIDIFEKISKRYFE